MGYTYTRFRDFSQMYTPTEPLKTLWTFWWIESRCGSTSSDVRAKPCVPKVCQLGKTRLNSATLWRSEDRRKTLIQRIFRQEGHPRATSAKEGKNGFVISRSPVQSRRVAPEFHALRRQSVFDFT